MTDASSWVFAVVRRLKEQSADTSALSEVYAALADLASALAVHSVIVAVDDVFLGRQVFGSRRAPFAEAELPFGLSGPPGVCTVPELRLDAASVGALVDAVGSVIARATCPERGLVTQRHSGRDALIRTVAEATSRAVRYRWGFTLVLVRFDVGAVLPMTPVIESMRARLRLGDVLEPYGDDGVALVLPATPGDRAPEILHRAAADGPRVCFGLASSPAESTDAPALIELAEDRLREAGRLDM